MKKFIGFLGIAGILICMNLPLRSQNVGKLTAAIFYQDFDLAKELVHGGADVNYFDKDMNSRPLIMCAAFDFVDMGIFLLDHGADINLQDENGTTALMAAAQMSPELYEALLLKGADIRLIDNTGLSILTYSCMGVLEGRTSLREVESILLKGLNPNEAAKNGPAEGYTCLMMAAANGNEDLLRLLVKHGADVNLKSRDGHSALGLAEENGLESMVRLLISLGAQK
jgi:uncharacterized protein